MKSLIPVALAVVLAQTSLPQGLVTGTTGGPVSREHWQRVLTPPPGRHTAEQCVVLDADVFAHAAPGLRDLRVLQGGRELPYAVDESHDDRETGTGAPPTDDRSIFDVVGVAAFHPGNDKRWLKNEGLDGRLAKLLLPAHVPVERITLHGVTVPLGLRVLATPRGGGSTTAPEPEDVRMNAVPGQASLMVTLGANLQNPAEVVVMASPAVSTLTDAVFEMRRREVCYQPITGEPVRMVFGDPEALPVHYDYAAHYKPTPTPVLAVMGPRETNPAYRPPLVEQPFAFTLRQKLGVAIGLCVGMMAVTLGALWKMLRR